MAILNLLVSWQSQGSWASYMVGDFSQSEHSKRSTQITITEVPALPQATTLMVSQFHFSNVPRPEQTIQNKTKEKNLMAHLLSSYIKQIDKLLFPNNFLVAI